MNRSIFLALGILLPVLTFAQQTESWTETVFTTPDDQYCILQDHRGLLWVGADSGLKSYDGYTVHDWRGEGLAQMGTGVYSLTEDSLGHLWVGTRNGLLRLDLKSGKAQEYHLPRQSQRVIFALFTASNGTVYAGTDDGFSIYCAEADSFQNYSFRNTVATYADGHRGTFWGYSVKDFVELPDGDILMGTWESGLLRYSPHRKIFRAYNQLNPMNSVFSLCVDNQGRVWIGTWGYGVQCIEHSEDFGLKTLQTMKDVQAPVRDICINPLDGQVRITHSNEVRLLPMQDGRVWVLKFNELDLERPASKYFSYQSTGNSIHSIYVDKKQGLVLGCNTGDEIIHNILKRKNGELLMAAGKGGIHVIQDNGTKETWKVLSKPWLKDNVFALCETRDGRLWVGQRMGVSVVKNDGKGSHIDVKNDSIDMTGYFIVNHITEDHKGNIWISSSNDGIVGVKNGIYHHYTSPASIISCFEDSRQRLWAISAMDGLLRYNEKENVFQRVNERYHLPSKKIYAINEDDQGALWLAADRDLLRLEIPDKGEAIVSSFTKEDGLPGLPVIPRATFRYNGKLYFGLTDGYVEINPPSMLSIKKEPQTSSKRASSLLITNIYVDGTPLAELDSAFAAGICASLPMSARAITVPPSVKKFSVEFALLSFSHTAQTQYAYQLEGYDEAWQYLDAVNRKATFERLPKGKYHLRLKAADNLGQWTEMSYALEIHVLSPWYRTWWALLVYCFILICIGWLIWRYWQMQQELKASRRFTATYSAPSQTKRAGRESAFLTQATELVRKHLDDPEFNRDRMAEELGVSVSTLFSRLKDLTGMNVNTFIQNIRLNAAADILQRDHSIRISELAYRVGFNDPKYFSQCFKKEFGVLPRKWLEQTQSTSMRL